MIPVLAVEDPESAHEMLVHQFGFVPAEGCHVAFGDQLVAVVSVGAKPDGMYRVPLDHVAFSVPDTE